MNQIISYLLIIIFLSVSYIGFGNNIKFSKATIDSLENQMELSEGKERFQILLRLSKLTRRNDPDLAATYMEQAKELIDENKDSKDSFFYFKSLSAVKLAQNKYKESISLAEKANKLKIEDIDPVHYMEILQFLGIAHCMLGENDKAQQIHFKGLRIADSLQLHKEIFKFYNAIGNVYREMNNSEMEEKYLLLTIEKIKEFGEEPIHLALAQGNLAIFYTDVKKYEEAEKIFLECIKIAEAEDATFILGKVYNNLALNHFEQNEYQEALEFFQKALVVAKEINVPSDIGLTHCNLGMVYSDINKYKLAKQHLDAGLEITKSIENKKHYEHALLKTFELYEKIGKHEKALLYFKEYSSLKDSFLNEKRIQVVAELEEKYEAEKKEKEILALSNEKKFAKKREKRLVNTILLLCFGLFAIGCLFYFLRQTHIKNSIIQNNKIELLEKAKEIIALESLVKGQESERQRLAKEMHDGLGGLLAISHSKLTNLCPPEMNANVVLSEARELIGNAYDQVRQISHNLMPLDLEKFGIVAALRNMVQRINQQKEIFIDFRTYHFDLLLNNELGLNIYRISQEALANILKSAKAKNVLIELIQHEETISLSIEDDGIGFDLNAINSGIGIRNMRNRTELLNGRFSIESRVSQGTSVTVLFPHFSDKLMPREV